MRVTGLKRRGVWRGGCFLPQIGWHRFRDWGARFRSFSTRAIARFGPNHVGSIIGSMTTSCSYCMFGAVSSFSASKTC